MNKQDNRLAFSVIAALLSGIALIYTFIMFPRMIFAIAGVSMIFLAAAFILTQNILSYASAKEKNTNKLIQDNMEYVLNQMETMNASQSQLDKATFLYTKQVAKTLSTLENNYLESQDALYKNLTEISNTQNKSTKLMIKYNQNTTTKMISSLKDLRNQLSETMIQGFDQIQPNNKEIIDTLEDIVQYLKSQSHGMEQSMGIQLNNVAHELQNISNSIQQVQISVQTPKDFSALDTVQKTIPQEKPIKEMPEDIPNTFENTITEITDTLTQEIPTENAQDSFENTASEITENPVQNIPAEDVQDVFEDTVSEMTENPAQNIPAEDVQDVFEDTASEITETATQGGPEESVVNIQPENDDSNRQLSPDEIAALFAAAEPTPKKTVPEEELIDEEEEEKPFTPTFTVVGKEPKEDPPVDTSAATDDPNRQLSPDEIAALFAAADPAPKKPDKAAEPVIPEPENADSNKPLSQDEIAALFAAAEPTPKKDEKAPEPVKEAAPVADDPNRQLSPEEIAALFASMG